MTTRVLSDHFGKVRNKLLEYSRHFDVADHGDIKGYGREALVQEFLLTHLPDQVEYLTGEILDQGDGRSGQVDIIMQSKIYPKVPLLGNLHLAYADAVIAAIEVKSNLTTQHLTSALEQFRRIKSLRRDFKIKISSSNPMGSIPCVVFAFKGPKMETLISSINKFSLQNKISLDEFCPDMVVVLEEGYYVCKNDGWQFPIVSGGYFRDWRGVSHETLVGIYNYLNNVIGAHMYAKPLLMLNEYFDKNISREENADA